MEELKKELVLELKKLGIELGEEAAIKLVQIAFRMMPKILAQTENKTDDLLIPLLALVEPKVIELLEKIDGK